MVKGFGLSTPPLERLATMVRAADTARLNLSPEAPGLLAAPLGLSRMYDDDLEQLSAGLLLYDAFYRWSRDATKGDAQLAHQQGEAVTHLIAGWNGTEQRTLIRVGTRPGERTCGNEQSVRRCLAGSCGRFLPGPGPHRKNS